jgi:hypothetical protein
MTFPFKSTLLGVDLQGVEVKHLLTAQAQRLLYLCTALLMHVTQFDRMSHEES